MIGRPDGAADLVLELQHVDKTYPAEPPVHALQDMSLRVRRGECLALVGASGSGKTTLLSVMGTLERHSRGVVRLGGRDITGLSDDALAALRARTIGFVFQQFFLLENASALENVENGLLYTGVPREERRQRAMAALDRVGLSHRAKFLPSRMSGGECQRVAIARALVSNPLIVLADEPTGNLDSAAGESILQLLLGLNRQGTTVIVVTHDQALAAHLPRVVAIHDGRIASDEGDGLRRAASFLDPVGPTDEALEPRALSWAERVRVASFGLRARRMRAVLSALGISIGVASVVAILGLSASSQAGLLAEIARLGTNLLTVSGGQNFSGGAAELPDAAPGMAARLPGVTHIAETGSTAATVYRSPLVPSYQTGGLEVQAASLGLLPAVGSSVAQGQFLNAATSREPVAVLGAVAAQQLGIDRIFPGERIWLGSQWFYLAGILRPAGLAPEIDSSVLIGFPAAETYLGFDGHPTTIYVRTRQNAVNAVYRLLAAQTNPEDPTEVDVSQPSSALVAQADAQSAFTGLFVGLGAVALFVGGVGVANIMVIAVLERRREIGLRRALGATRRQIRAQFLSEAVLLSLGGGAAGTALGAAATTVYALVHGWIVVVPLIAWAGGLGVALVIGAVAGFLPARRAASLSPTEALRTL